VVSHHARVAHGVAAEIEQHAYAVFAVGAHFALLHDVVVTAITELQAAAVPTLRVDARGFGDDQRVLAAVHAHADAAPDRQCECAYRLSGPVFVKADLITRLTASGRAERFSSEAVVTAVGIYGDGGNAVLTRRSRQATS